MNQIWKVKNVLVEMLTDRGFDSEENQKKYKDFINNNENVQSTTKKRTIVLSVEKEKINKDGKETLNVFFIMEGKFGKDEMNNKDNKGILQQAKTQYEEKENPNDLITQLVIFQNGYTTGHNKLRLEANSSNTASKGSGYRIEFMDIKFLYFNRSKSLLSSFHKIMSDKEIEEKIKPFYQESKLMQIKLTDPQVIYLGASLGNILEVVRSSDTSGKSTVYRRVIS